MTVLPQNAQGYVADSLGSLRSVEQSRLTPIGHVAMITALFLLWLENRLRHPYPDLRDTAAKWGKCFSIDLRPVKPRG